MRRFNGLIVSFALSGLLLCTAAQADEKFNFDPPQQTDATKVGVGIICDTTDEAEQYVSLRAAGQKLAAAVSNVNAAMKHPKACGLAAIAYVPHKTVSTKAVQGKLVEIVRITVIAGYTASGWHRVTNAVQYAVIDTKGVAI